MNITVFQIREIPGRRLGLHYSATIKTESSKVVQLSLYLGPEYSNEDIQKCLDIRKLSYRKVEDVAQEAASLLADNKIIAWFQGRMESGAARSWRTFNSYVPITF